MSDYWIGGLSGALVGAVLVRLVGFLRSRVARSSVRGREPEVCDQQPLPAEVVVHAMAAQENVADFADGLAVGDPALRELLRPFEWELSDQLRRRLGGGQA